MGVPALSCPLDVLKWCTLVLMDAVCRPFLCDHPSLETCREYIRAYLELAMSTLPPHACTPACRTKSLSQNSKQIDSWYKIRFASCKIPIPIDTTTSFQISDKIVSTVDQAIHHSLKKLDQLPEVSFVDLCLCIMRNFRFAPTPALASPFLSTTLPIMVRFSLRSLMKEGSVVCDKENLYRLADDVDENDASFVASSSEAENFSTPCSSLSKSPVMGHARSGTLKAVSINSCIAEVSHCQVTSHHPRQKPVPAPRRSKMVDTPAPSSPAEPTASNIQTTVPPKRSARIQARRVEVTDDPLPEVQKKVARKPRKVAAKKRSIASRKKSNAATKKSVPRTKKKAVVLPVLGVTTRRMAAKLAAPPGAQLHRSTTISLQPPQSSKRKVNDKEDSSGKRSTGTCRTSNTDTVEDFEVEGFDSSGSVSI